MKFIAPLLCFITSPVLAGTLTFEFVTERMTLRDYSRSDIPEITIFDSGYVEGFSFEVSKVQNRKFNIVLNRGDSMDDWIAVENPEDATPIDLPTGHLWGYHEGNISISLQKDEITIGADFYDYEDQAWYYPNSVWVDHNQGLYDEHYEGYWVASFTPSGPGEGRAFSTAPLVPIPVPASGFAFALMIGAGFIARKKSGF